MVALCLPPQIALKSPCGVPQKVPLEFLKSMSVLISMRSSYSLVLRSWSFSDGANTNISAKTHCNALLAYTWSKPFLLSTSLTLVFIREPETLGCRREVEVSAVLLLNRRFKCLAPLEVSHSVCSIIVKDKWYNELNIAVKKNLSCSGNDYSSNRTHPVQSSTPHVFILRCNRTSCVICMFSITYPSKVTAVVQFSAAHNTFLLIKYYNKHHVSTPVWKTAHCYNSVATLHLTRVVYEV